VFVLSTLNHPQSTSKTQRPQNRKSVQKHMPAHVNSHRPGCGELWTVKNVLPTATCLRKGSVPLAAGFVESLLTSTADSTCASCSRASQPGTCHIPPASRSIPSDVMAVNQHVRVLNMSLRQQTGWLLVLTYSHHAMPSMPGPHPGARCTLPKDAMSPPCPLPHYPAHYLLELDSPPSTLTPK